MQVPNVMEAGVEGTVLKAEVRDLDFYYGAFHALKRVSMPIYDRKVTALIGPSGCGKSTLLRCFNRMHDLYPGNRYEAAASCFHPDNTNLLAPEVDPIEVRMRISMVFQKPNPFPKSIYENVAYSLRVRGMNNKNELDDRVESALKGAALWNEVSNRLARARRQPVRRPAAAPVHRPRPGDPIPKSSSSTNRPRRSTRSPRPASRS
jgi:phosphate transport system ATP-binding protein